MYDLSKYFFINSTHVKHLYADTQSMNAHMKMPLVLGEMTSFIISCIVSQISSQRSSTVLSRILIPHSDWFISETPPQIRPLINRNDALISTSFFPFLANFQGLMRNA